MAQRAAPILVEVWMHVAKFLNLRDQYKLASTCRALWTMDLPYVNLVGRQCGAEGDFTGLIDTPRRMDVGVHHLFERLSDARSSLYAALQWAAQRWRRAHWVQIKVWHGNVNQLSEALACSQSKDLSRLKQVCLCWLNPTLRL